MNDMAASADAPAAPASALWLPGTALNCYEGNAGLRSWLMTPGLLTQRIRDAAGAGFGMQVLGEFAVGTEQDSPVVWCLQEQQRCADAVE